MEKAALRFRWTLCFACLSVVVGFPTLSVAQVSVTSKRTLSGHLVLPKGQGTRGIEVVVTTGSGDDTNRVWMLLDDEQRFRDSFRNSIVEVVIRSGINRPIRRIERAKLTVDDDGIIDLGDIDLRSELKEHAILIKSKVSLKWDVVRIAMWHGKPPKKVSLGSRQFPEIRIGNKVKWLLPDCADSIYFLIEQHADEQRGERWRSGAHHLFGPFDADSLPKQLTIERSANSG